LSCSSSITLDVTSKPSIQEAVTQLQEKEGKLHILVNKYSILFYQLEHIANVLRSTSSAQVGPMSLFFGKPGEVEDIGKAMFENESFEGWAALFDVRLPCYFLFFHDSRRSG
jgi:NAD(P)-dependent dehydrogenase (short-subunit alcohol dehydrogenase family)